MRDILVIGGGINGVGIARDAAGRGLDVLLCEKDDLAGHTSSASSKLIHGGLRYLENYEFRLVRESLNEREILLRAAPHIIWPVRIVLPVQPGMRPSWMLRAGLFLYDHLGKRAVLPGTKRLNLQKVPQGDALKKHMHVGFEYSDCWADDARLVVLNGVDAAERGATIRTRCECTALERHSDHWVARLRNCDGTEETVSARLVVNAAGPWVAKVLGQFNRINHEADVRLVKGSHIVTEKLYEGSHSYLFQSPDGRVIFSMPYQGRYTLIGTTDVAWELDQGPMKISDDETHYLCDAVNEYFDRQISPEDVIWSYAGVRPLYDDKAESASVVTRDYVFDLEGGEGHVAPILSIFGGKLTTYRRLAEHAMEKIAPFFDGLPSSWTADAPLPGGDFALDSRSQMESELAAQYDWMDPDVLSRMVGSYGTRISRILAGAQCIDDLGKNHGAGLYEAEVKYLRDVEFARTVEDILWRRSKLGLHMNAAERADMEQDSICMEAA